MTTSRLFPSAPFAPGFPKAAEVFLKMTMPTTTELGTFPSKVNSVSWALVDETKSYYLASWYSKNI